jgi:hypothetical protein
MSIAEIEDFDSRVNFKALDAYRMKVGRNTRKIVKGLAYTDMKRKPERRQLERIKDSGAVLEHADSIWLLDFWGKKDILGLILMPLTRHQTLHLNDCFTIKEAQIQ